MITKTEGDSMATFEIQKEHHDAFEKSIVERVGIDRGVVIKGSIGWTLQGGEEYGKVTMEIALPAQELLDLWNAAGQAASEG